MVPISSNHWARGVVHFRQVASPSQFKQSNVQNTFISLSYYTFLSLVRNGWRIKTNTVWLKNSNLLLKSFMLTLWIFVFNKIHFVFRKGPATQCKNVIFFKGLTTLLRADLVWFLWFCGVLKYCNCKTRILHFSHNKEIKTCQHLDMLFCSFYLQKLIFPQILILIALSTSICLHVRISLRMS